MVRVFARLHALDHPPKGRQSQEEEAHGPTAAGVAAAGQVDGAVVPIRDPAALLKPCWALAPGILGDEKRPGDYNQVRAEPFIESQALSTVCSGLALNA